MSTKFRIRNLNYVWDIDLTLPAFAVIKFDRLVKYQDLTRPWILQCPDGSFYLEESYENTVARMNNVIARGEILTFGVFVA